MCGVINRPAQPTVCGENGRDLRSTGLRLRYTAGSVLLLCQNTLVNESRKATCIYGLRLIKFTTLGIFFSVHYCYIGSSGNSGFKNASRGCHN